MARYIDLDKALERLNASPAFPNIGTDGYFLLGVVEDLLKNQPAADVIPKSEVERLTVELDAMRGAANTYKMHYENTMKEIERLKDYNTGVVFKHYFDGRKEIAREIFEEIEKALFNNHCLDEWSDYPTPHYYEELKDDIAELKKKYTEGKNEES